MAIMNAHLFILVGVHNELHDQRMRTNFLREAFAVPGARLALCIEYRGNRYEARTYCETPNRARKRIPCALRLRQH